MNAKKLKQGLTMIELLVVITIIAALAGVVASTINLPRQRAIAEDAIKRGNVEEIMQGLDAFKAFYGRYPSPASMEDQGKLAEFFTWPTEPNDFEYVYNYDSNTSQYFVYVDKSVDEGILKYYSEWLGIRECYGTVDRTSAEDCSETP
jgi:prepilin-type N-terminal cleavage/methylation domain-containing protein